LYGCRESDLGKFKQEKKDKNDPESLRNKTSEVLERGTVATVTLGVSEICRADPEGCKKFEENVKS
jgi:hypothetical protein